MGSPKRSPRIQFKTGPKKDYLGLNSKINLPSLLPSFQLIFDPSEKLNSWQPYQNHSIHINNIMRLCIQLLNHVYCYYTVKYFRATYIRNRKFFWMSYFGYPTAVRPMKEAVGFKYQASDGVETVLHT